MNEVSTSARYTFVSLGEIYDGGKITPEVLDNTSWNLGFCAQKNDSVLSFASQQFGFDELISYFYL